MTDKDNGQKQEMHRFNLPLLQIGPKQGMLHKLVRRASAVRKSSSKNVDLDSKAIPIRVDQEHCLAFVHVFLTSNPPVNVLEKH